MGMMVRAVLGLDPWDVFHQGLTAWINQWIPLSFGTVITIVSVLVLLLWIPLRQRPGIGTIANAAIIGFTTDATLAVLPEFPRHDRAHRGARSARSSAMRWPARCTSAPGSGLVRGTA